MFLGYSQDYGYTPGSGDFNQADARALVEMRNNGSRTELMTGTPASKDVPEINNHYFLGDIVMLQDVNGNQSKARVTEHIWSSDATGQKKYPTFEAV